MANQENKSMVSEVSICNQALSWLGQKRITSLDDPTTHAQLCKDNYPFLRDALLEERKWSFANDIDMSTTADKDAWGKYYSHPIPLGWIKVYRVYNNISGDDRGSWSRAGTWKKSGDTILTNHATIYMEGLKRVTDTGLFTQAFVQCLAARLAMDLCIPITENMQRYGIAMQVYGEKLQIAAASDGEQGANEQVQSNSLIDARAGGVGGFQ